MVGPTQLVCGGLVDHKAARGLRQLGRGELVVDAPADIVVESAPALAPPRVRTLNITGERTHHIHKLDAPSGTAITLAEEIVDNIDRKKDWKRGVTVWTNDGHEDEGDPTTADDLIINSVRDGEVPGIHTVMYDSEADMITIEHDAHSRKGFALGAVLAAEYTQKHNGLLTTSDLFKF